MAGNKSTSGFGRKLDWLKAAFHVTDGEIGAAVGASDSLVCRWRSGERTLDRVRGANVLTNLAAFFAARAEQGGKIPTLARALGLSDADITAKVEAYRSGFIDFLYAECPPPDARDPELSPVRQDCFFGMDGLLDALYELERRMRGAPGVITVYFSLEHSRILREPSADRLWETLRRLGGGHPVRLVFDNWTDAGEAAATLRAIMPFMQTGDLRLFMIRSAQKFFYSNISFYAEGTGMIITAEPAGGYGNSVSMLALSPDYIKGMSSVFARFDKNTKPMEKHLGAQTKDEAVSYGRLFEPGGDLKTAIDGINLLYMDDDAYMRLLKINGITGSRRAYRLERFVIDKRRHEEFLLKDRITEIFRLPAFDRMIRTLEMRTPDFSFHTGAVKADNVILRSLFSGMIDSLKRYDNLAVYLSRRAPAYPDLSIRIKGDGFVMLHSCGGSHIVWSDTWLLVYEYLRQYDELLCDGELITTRDAALAALKIRIESLGGV